MNVNGRYVGLCGKHALEMLSQHPDMPNRTMARLLRTKHPKIYSSVDRARGVIRYYRGAHGAKQAKTVSVRDFILPKPTVANPLSLPASKEHDWLPYIVPSNIEKWLVLPDIHVPYHNIAALTLAIKEGRKQRCDGIILNGDAWDCYALSRFLKDPGERDFPKEREAMRHFLAVVRKQFPQAEILYKQGNHEFRFEYFLKEKAPDFFGCEEFSLRHLLDLCGFGVTWIAEKRPIQIGKLSVLHGDEFGRGSAATVNPARTAFLRAKECVLVSHNHQTSEHNEPTLSGKLIASWSTGCLSELHPQYMPINKWNWGAAWIERDGEDDFTVHNFRIVKGRVV